MSSSPAADPSRRPRQAYRHWLPITTRWMDNDVYGHVNNVVCYAYFDTVVNRWLIERGALEIHAGPVIGLVVSSACDYYGPLSFPLPDALRVALAPSCAA